MLAMERGKKLNEVEDKTEQLSNDAKVIYSFESDSRDSVVRLFVHLSH